MQKLNYKIILIAALALVAVLLALSSFNSNRNKNTKDNPTDPVEQALSDAGIELEADKKIFSFINPYSKNGTIEYLAPRNDEIRPNLESGERSDSSIVKLIDIKSKEISNRETVVEKPKKVVWGSGGSIAYITDDGRAFYISKDRARQTSISSDATDIALSDESGILSIVSGDRIVVYETRPQPTEITYFASSGEPDSSVGTNEGVVFKSRSNWESYNKKSQAKKVLDAIGDKVAQYSAGDFIVIGSTEKSYLYNYKDETQAVVDGDVSTAIAAEVGSGVIFATVDPGQTEDATTLHCFNRGTGYLSPLYKPTTSVESFEASSGAIKEGVFYFTWGVSLNSLKINEQVLAKCIN